MFALLVTGCGRPAEVDQDDRVVVVRGVDRRAPVAAARPRNAGETVRRVEAAEDDPAQVASLTAAREADPYRLRGVDPQLLAEAAR